MSFISFSFLAFYLLALAWRWGPGWGRSLRIVGLLVLSWVFYAWHVPALVFLLLFSTLTDYYAACWLAATPPIAKYQRRTILAGSLVINLGLLGYFKYGGFLVETINDLAHLGWPVPDILLPIGISFYTFQSMSYTVDVYHGRVEAEKSFVKVACYIAFFPQLVAGPIVRAGEFLYQLARPRRFRAKVFSAGAYLILRGLFLKIVIADNLGILVNQHWEQAVGDPHSTLALAMLVFFSCQLFCDFAGYVDIARGVAYQLGFRLPINFNAPYLATSFTEFWRRWHITLSQWMRDYLYIPLGGSRKGQLRFYCNLMLVMLLSGFWHGAAWTLVAWGGVLGLVLVVEKLLGMDKPSRLFGMALVWLLLVQMTWILSMGLFRSGTFSDGVAIMQNALLGLSLLPEMGLAVEGTGGLIMLGWWLTIPVWLLHGRTWLAERTVLGPPARIEKAIYSGAMLAAVLMLYAGNQPFIYFQF